MCTACVAGAAEARRRWYRTGVKDNCKSSWGCEELNQSLCKNTIALHYWPISQAPSFLVHYKAQPKMVTLFCYQNKKWDLHTAFVLFVAVAILLGSPVSRSLDMECSSHCTHLRLALLEPGYNKCALVISLGEIRMYFRIIFIVEMLFIFIYV